MQGMWTDHREPPSPEDESMKRDVMFEGNDEEMGEAMAVEPPGLLLGEPHAPFVTEPPVLPLPSHQQFPPPQQPMPMNSSPVYSQNFRQEVQNVHPMEVEPRHVRLRLREDLDVVPSPTTPLQDLFKSSPSSAARSSH